jgi:protein phosphatase
MLERLTRDQTMAQDLVDQGALSASRAEMSPLSSILSSAIGGEAHPVVGRFDSAPEDVLLLCTDGLTRHVPDERIRQILLEMESAEQACQQLVQSALEGGGTDNVTVVVGRARR